MLQLHEADGAFAHLEEWLRGEGFFAPGGEHLVADLYLGYGLSASLRRTGLPPPPEPCPLPLARVCRPPRLGMMSNMTTVEADPATAGVQRGDAFEIGAWSRTWQEPDHRAAVDAVRTAIASGDVYQVNLVQHLSAPFAGSPSALAARLAPLTQPNDAPLGRAPRVCSRVPAGRSSLPRPSSSSHATDGCFGHGRSRERGPSAGGQSCWPRRRTLPSTS